jgi:transcription regulator, marR family
MKTYLFSRELNGKEHVLEKPLLEFKRFSRKAQRIIEKHAKVCGMECMGGPQGQVLHIVSHRAKRGLSTFIRDIEHELDISKSVASNLIKRMEKNGSIFLEVSETDKRAKMIHLTAQSKQQLKELHDFFNEIDRCLLQGVSEEELATFTLVMAKFHQNIEKLESEDANV